MLDQSQANRELIRNLAHEIKNPLGGIRGAAQLLDRELERPALHEYTQVIMKEADRLQLLMDRLLTPHRLPQPSQVNIHEVLERVRSVILAEFPRHRRAARLRHEPAYDRRRSRAAHPGDAQHRAQRRAGDRRATARAPKARSGCARASRGRSRSRASATAMRSKCASSTTAPAYRRTSASAFSIRSCRGVKAAAAWASRSRRTSFRNITERSRSKARRADTFSRSCCRYRKRMRAEE